MNMVCEPFQASAYYCSVLLCFFPGLISHVRDAYKELGVTVSTVTTLPGRIGDFPVRPPTLNVPDSLVVLGQAVLVLFKNFQNHVHTRFMEHRITVLMANAGVPSAKYAFERILYEKAMTIKHVLGCSFGLKKGLLEYIIDASAGTSRSNMVCSYLCDAVAWSGMEAIVFIYHTLWRPRSHALKTQFLQMQVRNLEEAFEKITAADYPKYFNILNPSNETKLIERSRFPTILALAQSIIRNRGATEYLPPMPPSNLILRKLKEIHDENAPDPVQNNSPSQASMRYNMEIEAEFVDDVLTYGSMQCNIESDTEFDDDLPCYTDIDMELVHKVLNPILNPSA